MKNFTFSYIPIDVPLGDDARTCLVLALFAVAPFFFRGTGKGKRECLLLCGGILLLALNPWCANTIAEHTNRVMSWRWIWIAPIAVATAMLLAAFGSRLRQATPSGRRSATVALTLCFLCAGAWTCRSHNGDFHFAWPQWKLPREYDEITELAALLPGSDKGPVVLAPARQAAWLPVVRPGLALVMGGHTQKGAYRKFVKRREHADRIAAQAVVERRPIAPVPDQFHFESVLDALRVTHIIAPRNKMEHKQFVLLQRNRNIRIVGETEHFFVLLLQRQ